MENLNTTPKNDTKGNVTYDPGWNDPPKLSYNVQQKTPNRPRNYLNKRVAFPLASTDLMPLPSTLVTSPQIPSMTPVTYLETPLKPDEKGIEIDSEKSLKEVKEILLEILENSSELSSKANDIKRRIGVMESMWSEAKLNNIIKVQMTNLATCLKDNEPEKADDIHRELMVDHVSTVGSWMPGVKLLIRHCIARCELLAIDKE